MDMIYFEQPLFVLFPVFLIFWQLFLYFLNKKTTVAPIPQIILTGIGVVAHAVAITVILLFGGTLSDVLVLVLLTGSLSLVLSPNPKEKGEE
jgi:ABC-type enterobactin transport system permease subunit